MIDMVLPKSKISYFNHLTYLFKPAETGQRGCGPEPSFLNRAALPHTKLEQDYNLGVCCRFLVAKLLYKSKCPSVNHV